MIDNSSFSPENNRLTAEQFNSFASFGREYPADEQQSSALNSFMRVTSSTTRQNQRTLDCLIKLFIQGAILEAFISQDFPVICSGRPIQSFIERKLNELLRQELHPSIIVGTINMLLQEIQVALQNLSNNVRQGIGVYDDPLSISQRQQFIDACDRFMGNMRERLNQAIGLLMDLNDNDPLTEDIVFGLMQFLKTECEFGRSWVRCFFEYTSLKTARMLLNYPINNEDQRGMIIQTLYNDEERYIEITISPLLLLNDIERLALYFFHEYISHLSASIYPRQVSREQMQEVVKSYKDIPRQLDEGWMVHTAQTFFYEKRTSLLGPTRQHLQQRMLGNVNIWATNMFHPYIGKTYLPKAQSGSDIADKFLTFLRDQVCDGDQSKANKLYYRVSFDLITHYPLFRKWHISFMATVYHWWQKYPNELASIIKACIKNISGDYIDLELLWKSIEHDQPKPDLEIPK